MVNLVGSNATNATSDAWLQFEVEYNRVKTEPTAQVDGPTVPMESFTAGQANSFVLLSRNITGVRLRRTDASLLHHSIESSTTRHRLASTDEKVAQLRAHMKVARGLLAQGLDNNSRW